MESTTELLHTARKGLSTEPHLGKRSYILKTLEDLKNEEFVCFQWHLSRNVKSEFEAIPKSYLENKSRHETADVMVDFYTDDKAVKVSVEILKKLSQDDAAQMLMEKYTSAILGGVIPYISTTDLLLCSLEELASEDFERFRQQLSQKLVIFFKAIPRGRLENKTREQTVDLMVGAHAEDGAVSVAVKILTLMGQCNAAEMLSGFDKLSGFDFSKWKFQQMDDLKMILYGPILRMRKNTFELFQVKLSQPTMIGLEAIPWSLLENKSREETVDVMVAYHTVDGAVTVMLEILKRIGQRNAAMKLQKEYRDLCQIDGEEREATCPPFLVGIK